MRGIVGRARDHYHHAADLINPLFKVTRTASGLPVLLPGAESDVRKALAHVRQCLKELESASVVQD